MSICETLPPIADALVSAQLTANCREIENGFSRSQRRVLKIIRDGATFDSPLTAAEIAELFDDGDVYQAASASGVISVVYLNHPHVFRRCASGRPTTYWYDPSKVDVRKERLRVPSARKKAPVADTSDEAFRNALAVVNAFKAKHGARLSLTVSTVDGSLSAEMKIKY